MFFFIFKQKTAYEMRISDWSSDVCSSDLVIVVPNRGAPQNVRTNDAWVSFINHDGSVHTLRWIGIQHGDERKTLSPPLVLNEPFGSDIMNELLYVEIGRAACRERVCQSV